MNCCDFFCDFHKSVPCFLPFFCRDFLLPLIITFNDMSKQVIIIVSIEYIQNKKLKVCLDLVSVKIISITRTVNKKVKFWPINPHHEIFMNFSNMRSHTHSHTHIYNKYFKILIIKNCDLRWICRFPLFPLTIWCAAVTTSCSFSFSSTSKAFHLLTTFQHIKNIQYKICI